MEKQRSALHIDQAPGHSTAARRLFWCVFIEFSWWVCGASAAAGYAVRMLV